MNANIRDHLEFLYGGAQASELTGRISSLVGAYRSQLPAPDAPGDQPLWNARDAILITYADQVQAEGQAPLRVLAEFLERHVADLTSAVHILPFYPWSSDDGFAVKDYLAVEPEYGTWEDIGRIGERFDLMFDAVLNHMSAQSVWFQRFLAGDPAFRDFFVTLDGTHDLSMVVRPRALPLLTEFMSSEGPIRVWTTFSADQVDLDVRNPEVLLALLEVILFYVCCGARFIRLDAIAYLWKKTGTPCIHLPQTHRIIQLMRSVLDAAAPQTVLITETNVPHVDNISYFGDGTNEAQMVYNFALPPLVIHAFRTGDASALSRWASELSTPSDRTTFFNFLASHDGVGLNPARGILPESEIQALVEGTLQRGGLISYKHNTDGSRSPYEMNINFMDALADPGATGPDAETSAIHRLLTAHAIMLALPGVPGIYFHSLLGSRGSRAAADASGIPRRINREKLSRDALEAELGSANSARRRVLEGFRSLLTARKNSPAFDPAARNEVVPVDPRLFVLRRTPDSGPAMLCLHNVSGETVHVPLPHAGARLHASLGATRIETGVRLDPHGHAWIAE